MRQNRTKRAKLVVFDRTSESPPVQQDRLHPQRKKRAVQAEKESTESCRVKKSVRPCLLALHARALLRRGALKVSCTRVKKVSVVRFSLSIMPCAPYASLRGLGAAPPTPPLGTERNLGEGETQVSCSWGRSVSAEWYGIEIKLIEHNTTNVDRLPT